MKDEVNIFWFRRDLRLNDNIGLSKALENNLPVLLLFIFDLNILNQLEDKNDRRVDYIHQALQQLNTELKEYNSSVLIKIGDPLKILNALNIEYKINTIYCNEDYEQYSIERDLEISKVFNLKSYKDHVVFRYDEILKTDQTPYTVYTPYSKQWKAKISEQDYKQHNSDLNKIYRSSFELPTLESIGFKKTTLQISLPDFKTKSFKNYSKERDIPSLDSTTKISTALRFGTISIRECVRTAYANNADVWLNELIWRDFFIQILAHFPKSAYQAFKLKYDNIKWINDETNFKAWCKGETGYPIVDAGMKELNETGFMHNRVRMIVSSFLCKHLLIDWRWGEAYFANKLNDYELASNVGNWQWAASSGCDAVPYFRVFNPTLQQEKFDPKFKYIIKWIPNFDPDNYLAPIIDHSFARQRAIDTYKKGLQDFENL